MPGRDLPERWRAFPVGAPDLEPLARRRRRPRLDAVREYVRGIDRAPDDFVTVVVPEVVRESLFALPASASGELVRLKAGLLREPNIVVTDVPVSCEDGGPARRRRASR